MAAFKKLLKHPRTQTAISWILSLYIRLVYYTCRRHYLVEPLSRPYLNGAENGIFAFWHGRMMMCPTIEPTGRKMHVLISLHRDGKLISDVIAHFGEATISGSSSRGGRAAVKEMLRVLKNGDNVSVTPDGPRGPVHIAEMGIVTIAKISGKPVIPVTFSASRHRRMASWDRFMLALPFGKIVFAAAAPIYVARESDQAEEEHKRLEIEQALNHLSDKADLAAQGGLHA